MRFGIKLHHSGAGASPENMKRWAHFAEAMGFHLIMTADHTALTPEVVDQYPAPYYEPFTSLAWLAAHTNRILLGTTVIVVPHRNPFQLAHLVANVDQLSEGRLVFGVGVGWAKSEFEVLGIPFDKRGAMTDDYLAAMQVLWAHDAADYDGHFVSFRDVTVSPKPAQSPHPPIWVGGSTKPAMWRAIRFGAAWHPIGVRADWLRDEAMPKLARLAGSAGRPTPALCPRIWCRLTDQPLPEQERMAGEGTLDQIHRDLLELQSLGADYVLLDTKRSSLTAASPRHNEEAWRTLATLAEQVIDLEAETVR